MEISFDDQRLYLAVILRPDEPTFSATWTQLSPSLPLPFPIRLDLARHPSSFSLELLPPSSLRNPGERYVPSPACDRAYRAAGGCLSSPASLVLCCLGEPLRAPGEYCWASDGLSYDRYRIRAVSQDHAVAVRVSYLLPGNVSRDYEMTLSSRLPAQGVWDGILVAEGSLTVFAQPRTRVELVYDLAHRVDLPLSLPEAWFFLDKRDPLLAQATLTEQEWLQRASCASPAASLTAGGVLTPHFSNSWGSVLQASPDHLFSVSLPVIRIGQSESPDQIPALRIALAISLKSP